MNILYICQYLKVHFDKLRSALVKATEKTGQNRKKKKLACSAATSRRGPHSDTSVPPCRVVRVAPVRAAPGMGCGRPRFSPSWGAGLT
jgi:hypothetical protein